MACIQERLMMACVRYEDITLPFTNTYILIYDVINNPWTLIKDTIYFDDSYLICIYRLSSKFMSFNRDICENFKPEGLIEQDA